MGDVEAILHSMITGDDSLDRLRTFVNELFAYDLKLQQAKNPREGLHAGSLLAGFTGKWRLCYREHVLNKYYIGLQEARSYDQMRIDKMGWYVHLMLQRLFKQAGYALEIEETHIDEKYGIYHTPDIVSLIPQIYGQRKVLWEIKSMNKNSFEKATREFPMDPQRGHGHAYKQLLMYMYLFGLTNPDDLGVILVFCKDNSDFYTWEVKYDADYLAPYIQRIDVLMRYYAEFEQSRRAPIRVCESEQEPRAKTCPMRDICFSKDKAKRDTFLRTTGLKNVVQKNVSLIHEDEDG